MDHCNGLIHYQDICHYLGAHFDNIKKNAWHSDSYNRVAYTIDSLEENNQIKAISNHVPMPAGSNAYKFA